MQSEYDDIFMEYRSFLRVKNAMMERIGNALEGVVECLVYEASELTDTRREKLEQIQDRLEAIYEGLEGVLAD